MSNSLPVIYLARHGETAWSLTGQHTGRTDLPLTERGERNARRLGQRLAGLIFAKVLTSPLQRAARTCELAGFRAAAETDANLVEWNYGDYEGLRTAQIHAKQPDWQLFRDGCPGGESPAQVGERADGVVSRLREIGGNVLIFSSGHFLRVLAARWLGLEPVAGRLFMLKTAGLSALGYEHNLSLPVIEFWDDTRHADDSNELAIKNMKATQLLHNQGQSLWLDNITRDLLNNGTLKRYIEDLSVTGLTSNPTIFDHAIKNSSAYDRAILDGLAAGQSDENLFFDLALQDITRAADLFRPIHDRTNGVDGWVSLEVSPLLAHDTASTLAEAKELFARARRPNLFIKIPGTREGLPAIEEAIFAGVPVNVTLLFSREQYVAAAEAHLRGIERRIAAGLNPRVGSVASLFISRWDAAVAGKVPAALNNQLGIAVARRTYKAYLGLLRSPRWQRACNEGAVPQRLLWASTGTKDPKASDALYITTLAAPLTVNTMPEATLKAFADHGQLGAIMAADGGDCEEVLAKLAQAGVNVDALAVQLQDEGAKSFVKSWNDLLTVIASKSAMLQQAA
jgi:transaldolase